MAQRVYLLPQTGDGLTPETAFRPAYVDGIVTSSVDYGREGWFLVVAEVTSAQHTAIVANADATALPANLDQAIGAALATVQAKLEAANMPSDWVTAVMTYRTLAKWVLRLILLLRRFHGLRASFGDNARLFGLITLDNTVGDLSITVRQQLVAAAASFGLDTSGITLTTTIRVALRMLLLQMTSPASLGGVVA